MPLEIAESPAARRVSFEAAVGGRFAETVAPFLRTHSAVYDVVRTNETLQADFPPCGDILQ